MRKKKKLIIIAGTMVLILIIILLNLRKGKGSNKVDALVVKRDNIISKVRTEGTLKALNQVQIGSDVMGRIIKLKVKEGVRVRKGDALCIIDQSTYVARLKRAKASLNFTLAKLTKAEEDLRRNKELFENKLISKEQYEEAKLNYEMIKAEAESAQESYNEAKENYNKTIITSPVDGEVVQLNKEEGEMAIMGTINTPGSVIMTIAERSKMFVKALIDETEVIKIVPKQLVTITIDALPDTTFNGKVTRIGGIPESYGTEEAVNFPIEVEILGTHEKLYPGMSATCEITVGVKDSTLVIPYSALGRKKIQGKEQDVVLLSKGKKVKQTLVKLGLTGEKGVEIIEGVAISDTVLIGPYKILRKLKDGDKVEVKIKEISEVEKKRGKRRDKVKVRVTM
ncbi:efflux RND transporter periplasmic adaptor subunit [candidate division WOR-3 bacterium]|nr:efflux RND transporter periplasmic adaptor subunit [candidate division WOR-3 bacterium]